MFFLMGICGCLLACSIFSWLINNERQKTIVACIGTALASAAGASVSVHSLSQNFPDILIKTNLPSVVFSFGVDGLSALFLIAIFGLSLFSAIYGIGYLKGNKRLIVYVPFFPMLVASMATVTMARDAFSFLFSWEIMSLSSFFLVTSEHEDRVVQNAGWIYLIATHIATAFLMFFFLILAKQSGSMLFNDFAIPATPILAGTLFVFALVGFGTKAGLFPLHVWLPHAHPAAPSYISALMSGVMIKTGIYGILRAVTLLGPPPLWWGVLLLIIGVLSALLGILFAVMQNNLKKLFAYSSIENIGIISCGIGLGLIGISKQNNLIAILGFAGALFHIINHAAFKGLLFLAAGSVVHTSKTLNINLMGGLIKKTRRTALVFLIGSIAICGLPPFNGFISEWLIYIGLFNGGMQLTGLPIILCVAAIVGIAFAGGLAVMTFTKVFGTVFLGEPRTDSHAHESPLTMLIPMYFLAALCALIALFPGIIMYILLPAISILHPSIDIVALRGPLNSLNHISIIFLTALTAMALGYLFYSLWFKKKKVETTVTWDCGFSFPTAKMQYSASSFAEPVGTFFKAILKPVTQAVKFTSIFPVNAAFSERSVDIAETKIFAPPLKLIESLLLFIRAKKKNTVQSYLLFIFLTLIVLIIWEVCVGF